uniref:C2H2-type domain-containing protein n=1 Tax=Scophthalmus maximus TaxID=52904 RepID=A0A8D3DKP1_SCOMX
RRRPSYPCPVSRPCFGTSGSNPSSTTSTRSAKTCWPTPAGVRSCRTASVQRGSSYHMTRHLRNQHGAGQHVCPTCGKSLGSFAELKRHKRTHTLQILSCPDCEEKFTNKGAFLAHMLSHSKNRPTETEGQGLQQSGEVENQAISDSSEKNRNKDGDCSDDAAENDADSGNGDTQDEGCDSAGKTDESSVAKSQDGGGKKEKVAAKTKTKGHFCPICVGRRFRGPNKLARHMRTHTKEKPFTCPRERPYSCTKSFRSSSGLRLHGRQHMEVRPSYECPECGRTYGRMTELRMHQRYHTGDKPYTCTCCNKLRESKTVREKKTTPRAHFVNVTRRHLKRRAGAATLRFWPRGQCVGLPPRGPWPGQSGKITNNNKEINNLSPESLTALFN